MVQEYSSCSFWFTCSPADVMEQILLIFLILNWVVVSNIFYVHPYLGKIPILTNIFQRGWNHQLVNVEAPYFCVIFFLLSYLDMSNQFRLYCKVFHTFKVGSYQLNLWDYCIPPIGWNNPSHKFIFGHLQGFLTPHWYPFITSDGAHNVDP